MKDSLTINDRLYVELVPTDQSRDYLQELTEQIGHFVMGRMVKERKWHVTVLHFGKVRDVLNDLRQAVPELSDEAYLAHLEVYAAKSRTVLPRQSQLTLAGFDLFGPHKNVLVLRFDLTDELALAHQAALAYLLEFLGSCGVSDPLDFIRHNHNFHHALTIKPHLTIARAVRGIDQHSIEIPTRTLSFNPADIHGL